VPKASHILIYKKFNQCSASVFFYDVCFPCTSLFTKLLLYNYALIKVILSIGNITLTLIYNALNSEMTM